MSRRCAHVSVVTSLYRSAARLEAFLAALETALKAVERGGLRVQSVIVANDPDKRERRLLRDVMESSRWWRATCKLVEVPRETLYASWNRGVQASSGEVLTFWNVDDDRNPQAMLEGVRLVQGGATLVTFPWLKAADDQAALKRGDRKLEVMDRDHQEALDPRADFVLGPFFMAARQLFEQYGDFDEQFHIIGDLDWQLRVLPRVELAWGESLGGVFYLHDSNLSSTGVERLRVEQNVVYKRYDIRRPQWPLDAAAYKLTQTYVASRASARGAGGG